MKKIISVIFACVLLLVSFALPVCADDYGIVKVDRVSAKAGDSISVPVSFNDCSGVYVIRFRISYDKSVLEYVKVKETAKDSFNYTVNETDDGIIVVMDGKSIGNVDGNIKLCTLEFKVKKNAPAGRSLLPVYIKDKDVAAIKEENGKVSVVSVTPDTSAGSVTVLCSEHKFDIDGENGDKKCSVCGAVKEKDGSVSVDDTAGLPEVDISAPSQSASDAPVSSHTDSEIDDTDQGKGLKLGHFIPIIAAVIIGIIGVIVKLTTKKKASDTTEQ